MTPSVLITQGESKARRLRQPLESVGIAVHAIPLIEIKELECAELEASLRELPSFDWLLFTSSNSVAIMAGRARLLGKWPPQRVKVGVVGPGTAKALEREGAQADLIASDHRAEGLLAGLQAREGSLRGRKILLPLARIARPWLREALEEAGARLSAPAVYDTVPAESNRAALNELLRSNPPDVIALASSSAAENLVALTDSLHLLKPCAIAAIGPVTADTARNLGLSVKILPAESSFPALAGAIRDFLQSRYRSLVRNDR
ncbi:MAG TPA: uroporphyrinogen-III synthase [Acidobacteriota bacterium]|nr:uroporphyrinogen-III synthase [Acidobacteriota bacterium]